MLEILEVKFDELRCIEQPTQFDKIILPDEAYFSPNQRKFTREYRETIDRVRDFALKNRTPTSSKKIYYFYGRRQIGEERLAEYFKSKSYEVIQPEKLTLDEQLNLLINAESFASTIGSISHNSLFLRDDTETIFIPRSVNGFTQHQDTLNQVRSLNVNYIDSTLSIFFKNFGPYCYIISEQLKRFFGDKFAGYEEEDFKVFLQYVKNCMSEDIELNQVKKKLYDPVLEDFMAQLKQRKDLIVTCDMPKGWETFRPVLSYQTHVSGTGWGTWVENNQVSNLLEHQRSIQAVKINFPKHKIFYSVYYDATEGWSEEVSNGQQAGTTGKSKSIYGIRIQLDEAGQKEFDVLYRVHKFDDTWTPWAKNGELIYSHGVKLNAIQIKLEPKAAR